MLAATEDGSFGHKGLVTDLLGEFPRRLNRSEHLCLRPPRDVEGHGLLAESRGVPCQVSLEERMACGMGACLGCSVPAGTKTG